MCDRGAAALADQRRTLALSAQRDSELGLPPALPLPDGEEFPHSVNHIHIRTLEQVGSRTRKGCGVSVDAIGLGHWTVA